MLAVGAVFGQNPVDTSNTNSDTSNPAAIGRTWGGGNVYLAEELATLERRPCVAAKLRQQVRLLINGIKRNHYLKQVV